MLIWGNMEVQTKGKSKTGLCVLNFLSLQWVSRDLALAWVLGVSQAWRRDVAADPEPKNQRSNSNRQRKKNRKGLGTKVAA